jgi:hypothetical protein
MSYLMFLALFSHNEVGLRLLQYYHRNTPFLSTTNNESRTSRGTEICKIL